MWYPSQSDSISNTQRAENFPWGTNQSFMTEFLESLQLGYTYAEMNSIAVKLRELVVGAHAPTNKDYYDSIHGLSFGTEPDQTHAGTMIDFGKYLYIWIEFFIVLRRYSKSIC